MSFRKGFTKVAQIKIAASLAGTALNAGGKVLGGVAKAGFKMGGGVLGTALTLSDAVNTFGNQGSKMRQSAMR